MRSQFFHWDYIYILWLRPVPLLINFDNGCNQQGHKLDNHTQHTLFLIHLSLEALRWAFASAILSGKNTMGKSCCAVGCSARHAKGCGIQFYRFPKDPDERREWISAVSRKNWKPTEYSWIWSNHFVGDQKSNNSTSPAYNPTLFTHIKPPKKRKAEKVLRDSIGPKTLIIAEESEAEVR